MNASSDSNADSEMHPEFYSCVARVSDLPDRIALAMARSPGITEAQVRAYYAQYPIGKIDTDGAPCYAQYWRIPKNILVLTRDGQEGDIGLTFPQAVPGEPLPPGGLEGLGTREIRVGSYPGGIPGRFLYASDLNPDGSVRYNPETDVLVRDEAAGFELVIQKLCDIGEHMVDAIPIDRSEGFRFHGNIKCDALEAISSLSGITVTTSLDDRLMLSYFISRSDVGRIREINKSVQNRIRSFLGQPVELRPITSETKEE